MVMEPTKTQGTVRRRWLTSATDAQGRETGMAVALVCMLVSYWGERPGLLPPAMLVLLTAIAWPRGLRPAAAAWFGIARVAGAIVSKVGLIVVFFLVVTPIGMLRRGLGRDPLQMRKWKNGPGSVLVERPGVIQPQDLTDPF